MKPGYIIMDASIKYMDARNVLEEGLIYNESSWVRKVDNAQFFQTIEQVMEKARELNKELPVRVFKLDINGRQVNLTEIKF